MGRVNTARRGTDFTGTLVLVEIWNDSALPRKGGEA